MRNAITRRFRVICMQPLCFEIADVAIVQVCPACNGDGVDPSCVCSTCGGKAREATQRELCESCCYPGRAQ